MDEAGIDALTPSAEASRPKACADESNSSPRIVVGRSSTMDLRESPRSSGGRTRELRRSESQVWLPREASSSERPSWASVGHHAIVPWRSPPRFDGNSSIRIVRKSEGSYDAENDSIWRPLESDTIPFMEKETAEEDEHTEDSSTGVFEERKARVNQPAMPSRDPPSPPTSRDRQDSLTTIIGDDETSSSKEKKNVKPSVKTEKKSRFVEHVDENEELLRRLGIPYESQKRRRSYGWFGSLAKR